jgi:hypothetical protein
MNTLVLLATVILPTGLMLTISCFCAMATDLDARQEKVVQLCVWVSGLMIGAGIVMLALAGEG